jgi:hypothetical protein
MNAPQAVITEVQRGTATLPEIQLVTIYNCAGGSGAGLTLAFKGTAAGTPITPTNLNTFNATAIAASINGISTIPTATVGGSGGAVTVAQATTQVTGAVAFTVTFPVSLTNGLPSSTSYTGAQPLLTLSAITITGGSNPVPVQSIVVSDTVLGQVVQTLTTGLYDFSSNLTIMEAINRANPATNPASVINAITYTGSTTFPVNGTYVLVGGNDGAFGSVASDASGANTVANRLAQVATGGWGEVDFFVAALDAYSIMAPVQTFLASALANNLFIKAILGPAAGTSYTTLTTAYQTSNSDRVTVIGHGALAGPNPISPGLLGSVPGFVVAGMVAGQKAATSAEFNLYGVTPQGLSSQAPTDAGTAQYLTVAQLNALASAGFTVFQYSTTLGRLVTRDLITTAPQTDSYGNQNWFMYLSERDCFDTLAYLLVAAYQPILGSPSSTAAQVVAQMNSIGTQLMAAYYLRYHNGATVSTAYNVVTNVVTVNIGYADRRPLNTIIINLAPVTPAAS